PAMSDLSWLNPTPHAIAVYASRPLSPGVTQHSLPSGRCPLLGPVFHRLDRTSLPGALIRSPRRRGQVASAAIRDRARPNCFVNLSKTSLRGGQIDCGPQCAALDGQCKLGLEGIVSKRKDSMYRSLFDKQSPGNPLGDALKGLTNLSSLNQTHNLGERWLRHRGTPCNFCPTEARRHPRRTADQIRSCTGVGENGRAIAFHVLVKPQAKANFGQHTSK